LYFRYLSSRLAAVAGLTVAVTQIPTATPNPITFWAGAAIALLAGLVIVDDLAERAS